MVESGFADADFLISIIKEDKDMLSKLAAIEAIKLLDGNEAEKALEFIVDFYTGKMADEVLFDNDPIAELRLDEKLSEDESFYIYSNYQTYDEDTHDFYNRMASACIGIFGHFGRRAQTHFLRPF